MVSLQKITIAATLCFSLTPNFAIAQETSPVRPVPRPEAPSIQENSTPLKEEKTSLLRSNTNKAPHCEDIPVINLGKIACRL